MKSAAKKSHDKMLTSSCYMGLVTKDFADNPLCLLQMGLAIMLDKPILLVVEEGTEIPQNLRKVAVDIRYFRRDDNDSLHNAAHKALGSIPDIRAVFNNRKNPKGGKTNGFN